MKDINQHPIKDVYDLLRTSRLNILYYGHKLKIIKRINLILEYIIAIFASSSIGSLWLWKTNIGGYIWKTLVVITAFLAVLKPIINFTKKISFYESLIYTYNSLFFDLKQLLVTIRQKGKYDKKLQIEFLKIIDKEKYLISQKKEQPPNDKLLQKYFNKVNEEYPIESFFIPKE